MKNVKITEVMFDGNLPKEYCENLKERFSGKTYMQFEISYSNYAGNCNLIVRTKYKTSKKELKEFFVFCVLCELAHSGLKNAK